MVGQCNKIKMCMYILCVLFCVNVSNVLRVPLSKNVIAVPWFSKYESYISGNGYMKVL